jgi:hypothetical protein
MSACTSGAADNSAMNKKPQNDWFKVRKPVKIQYSSSKDGVVAMKEIIKLPRSLSPLDKNNP